MTRQSRMVQGPLGAYAAGFRRELASWPAGPEQVGMAHRDAELGQHSVDLVLAAGAQPDQLVALCRGPDYAGLRAGVQVAGGGRLETSA
jgi:hypothetical protein